jgi:Repeat of Unknown Function (DUF347)
MNDVAKQALTKVPAVTLGLWVIKVLATTLGETGGDTVTMTLNWGYLAGVVLFGIVLVVLVVAQTFARRFHAALYWATIVASTTFGTTMADFADRSLGIGYTGGSLLLLGWTCMRKPQKRYAPSAHLSRWSGIGSGAQGVGPAPALGSIGALPGEATVAQVDPERGYRSSGPTSRDQVRSFAPRYIAYSQHTFSRRLTTIGRKGEWKHGYTSRPRLCSSFT